MELNDAGPAFVAALREALGEAAVRPAGAAEREEPRGRFHGREGPVALPASTEAVAATVRLCAAHRVPVVARGGGTGLVGGTIMADGALPLILSLDRLSRVREVAAGDGVMIAEAGVTLAGVQEAARAAGRLFPLSLAAEGTAQIGGNLATNAGGITVLRYGNARELTLGLEAVMADGSVLHGLKRLRKDNTGYDIRNLLIGSEGTLGIITAAALRLFPIPAETATAYAAVPSPAAALALLRHLQAALGETVTAFELIHRIGLDFQDEAGMAPRDPLRPRPDWLVLTEAGGHTGTAEAFEAALMGAAEAELLGDAVLARSESQRTAFWALREAIPAANRRVGAIVSHDIALPLGAVPGFIAEGAGRIAAIAPELRINCFGHLGDGNLHYNVFPPPGVARERYDDRATEVTVAVYELVDAAGGSISAEHGIGRLKAGVLPRYADPARMAAMRAVKAALDPLGILNPGAVLA